MASPLSAPPAGYRLTELREGLLRLAAPPCDGDLTLSVVGTVTGVEVSRVRCSSQFGELRPAFPLDSTYQAAVTAVLDQVVAALDDLAVLAGQWRATERKEAWNAKVLVRVQGGVPVAVRTEHGLPNHPTAPVALHDLLPERVARLRRRGYRVPDPGPVASLLQQHPVLESCLRAVPAALAPYFPHSALALQVEASSLVVLVTPADQPDAFTQLERFDEAWRALALPGSEWLLIDLAGEVPGAPPAPAPGVSAA